MMRKRAASRTKPAQPPPTHAVAIAISPNLDALLRFDDSLRRRGARVRPQTAPCEIEIGDAWRESAPPAPAPPPTGLSRSPLPPWDAGSGGLSPRGGAAIGGGLPPPPRGPRRPRSRTVEQKLTAAGNARDGASTVRGARSSAHLRGQGRNQYRVQREGEGDAEEENPYINRAPALPPFVAEVWRAAVLAGSKPASASAMEEVEAEAEARASQGGSLEGDVRARDATVVAREAGQSRDAIFSREAGRSRDAVLSREANRSRDASRPRNANSRDAHRSSNDADGRTSIHTVTSPTSSLHAPSRPASPKRGDAKDGKLGGASPCGKARPLQKLFAKVRMPSVHHKHTTHAHDDDSEAMQALWAELGRRDTAGSGTTSAVSSQRGRE